MAVTFSIAVPVVGFIVGGHGGGRFLFTNSGDGDGALSGVGQGRLVLLDLLAKEMELLSIPIFGLRFRELATLSRAMIWKSRWLWLVVIR